MHQRNKSKAASSVARRKRFSPLMLVGLSVPVVVFSDNYSGRQMRIIGEASATLVPLKVEYCKA